MATASPPSAVYTPEEAARFLSLKVQTLALWRSTQRYGLPYVRCGSRIRYRLADLEKFLEDRTIRAE